tara:strand:- start:638 stop:928 length:291 start_codon:yes stop_codon:yes gene_type:complete
MKIIEFKGYRCFERPIDEWNICVCKHLKPYISKPNENKPSSIVRILQDGSRSSEIFIFIKGPLPNIDQSTSQSVAANESVITCNSCWINIYVNEKL